VGEGGGLGGLGGPTWWDSRWQCRGHTPGLSATKRLHDTTNEKTHHMRTGRFENTDIYRLLSQAYAPIHAYSCEGDGGTHMTVQEKG
jgi:hypothetical protein